ncbi:MAG: hypothetical protein LBD61_00715 [Endomicrobium sp.]|jgi:hypothetical protein|nr:hypothetical protein [Endomicrobium sp.]
MTAEGKIHMEGCKIYPKVIPSASSSIGLEYETFKIYDWRHQKSTECSCNPEDLCDYVNMKENDLPHGVSAAYFKDEVLSKYEIILINMKSLMRNAVLIVKMVDGL